MKDTTFSLKVKRAIASKIGNKLFQWMFVDLTIKETGCNFEVIVSHEKSYSFCVSSLDDDNVRITYAQRKEASGLSENEFFSILEKREENLKFDEIAGYIKKTIEPSGHRAPQCVPIPNSAGC